MRCRGIWERFFDRVSDACAPSLSLRIVSLTFGRMIKQSTLTNLIVNCRWGTTMRIAHLHFAKKGIPSGRRNIHMNLSPVVGCQSRIQPVCAPYLGQNQLACRWLLLAVHCTRWTPTNFCLHNKTMTSETLAPFPLPPDFPAAQPGGDGTVTTGSDTRNWRCPLLS
jgi:hypothetical protein